MNTAVIILTLSVIGFLFGFAYLVYSFGERFLTIKRRVLQAYRKSNKLSEILTYTGSYIEMALKELSIITNTSVPDHQIFSKVLPLELLNKDYEKISFRLPNNSPIFTADGKKIAKAFFSIDRLVSAIQEEFEPDVIQKIPVLTNINYLVNPLSTEVLSSELNWKAITYKFTIGRSHVFIVAPNIVKDFVISEDYDLSQISDKSYLKALESLKITSTKEELTSEFYLFKPRGSNTSFKEKIIKQYIFQEAFVYSPISPKLTMGIYSDIVASSSNLFKEIIPIYPNFSGVIPFKDYFFRKITVKGKEYLVPKDLRSKVYDVLKDSITDLNNLSNIIIKGPSGCGKSKLVSSILKEADKDNSSTAVLIIGSTSNLKESIIPNWNKLLTEYAKRIIIVDNANDLVRDSEFSDTLATFLDSITSSNTQVILLLNEYGGEFRKDLLRIGRIDLIIDLDHPSTKEEYIELVKNINTSTYEHTQDFFYDLNEAQHASKPYRVDMAFSFIKRKTS